MNIKKHESSLDNRDDQELYDRMLNDCYGDTVKIAGMEYDTAFALRSIDETAYNCGFNDWADQEDRDNPIWECGECGADFENEDDAEECCKHDIQAFSK